MNYLEHNKELHGALYKPEEPVIFTKADSARLSLSVSLRVITMP